MNSQVRYNGGVYDVLGNITLGTHHFLIIGDGSEQKFFDIAFIEKKIENDKVRYVIPNIDYEWGQPEIDYVLVQGQCLMDHIVNEIKDAINQERLTNREDTRKYIQEALEILETNPDIKSSFFNMVGEYTSEQLEESIKTLIGHYDSSRNKESVNLSEQSTIPDNFEETVNKIYDDLEKTQNFGISTISENTQEYVIDPTSHVFVEKQEYIRDGLEQGSEKVEAITTPQEVVENVSAFESSPKIPTEKIGEASNLSVSDIQYMLQTKGASMPMQERLYWENEAKLRTVPTGDVQIQVNSANKGRAMVLSNGKSLFGDRAAYVSITFMLCLIGSFELLLTVILLAKNL